MRFVQNLEFVFNLLFRLKSNLLKGNFQDFINDQFLSKTMFYSLERQNKTPYSRMNMRYEVYKS